MTFIKEMFSLSLKLFPTHDEQNICHENFNEKNVIHLLPKCPVML